MDRFASCSPLKIGLLGGSFNPAHTGHLHISLEALKRCHLDAIWWLVSPANPFKDPATLAPFDTRLDYARQFVTHPHIWVSDFEQQYDCHFTIDTVQLLKLHYPQHHFVWLMGSDNLVSFHRWDRWEDITASVPIAILDRAPMTHHALRSPFAVRYQPFRVPLDQLAACPAPAWDFAFIRRHPESATYLRKTLGENAFLVHN